MIDYTVYEVEGPADLTIVLLTDLHDRNYVDVLATTRKVGPDIICVCGDFLLNKSIPEESIGIFDFISTQKNALNFISDCKKICETYVSFGNHEWIISGNDIKRIESTGAIVLDDSWKTLSQHTDTEVYIGGLNSAFLDNFRFIREMNHDHSYFHEGVRPVSNPINYDWLEEFESLNGYKILLSHHPEYWSIAPPFLSERKIDLVLAGHAHGGQVRIGNHGLFASGQGWFPQYTSGKHIGKNGVMIISRGLSNPVKVPRIFNNPEVVSVQIKKK